MATVCKDPRFLLIHVPMLGPRKLCDLSGESVRISTLCRSLFSSAAVAVRLSKSSNKRIDFVMVSKGRKGSKAFESFYFTCFISWDAITLSKVRVKLTMTVSLNPAGGRTADHLDSMQKPKFLLACQSWDKTRTCVVGLIFFNQIT